MENDKKQNSSYIFDLQVVLYFNLVKNKIAEC